MLFAAEQIARIDGLAQINDRGAQKCPVEAHL